MNQRERNDLDRHITGNGGEDSMTGDPAREALAEMLRCFDKPRRDEWMNDAAWRDACRAVEAARAALSAPPVQPEPVAWCWRTDLTEILPSDGWCVVHESDVDISDAVPLYATPPKAPVQPEPVAPTGWKYVLVNEGWEPLMSALERAHRKGYMPDAVTDYYEGFDYRDATPPKAPVQPEPVAWMNPRTEFVTTAFAWPHIKTSLHTVPLYATPPKAEPLSDEQIIAHADNFGSGVGEWWGFGKASLLQFAHAILKGKP